MSKCFEFVLATPYRSNMHTLYIVYCDEKFRAFNFRTQPRIQTFFDDENFPNYSTDISTYVNYFSACTPLSTNCSESVGTHVVASSSDAIPAFHRNARRACYAESHGREI